MIPDLTAVVYLAVFGLVCGALAIGGGLIAGIWFVVNHVQIVW